MSVRRGAPPARSGRQPTQAAFTAGFVHAVVVFAAMLALGYPLLAIDGAGDVIDRIDLFGSLVVLAGVPTYVFVRTRLLTPLLVIVLGGLSALVVSLATPGPTFVTLGEHALVDGPTYLEWYADGWPVWLVVAGLAGSIDYVLSVPSVDAAGPFETRPLPPLAWRPSLLAGLGAGLLHAFAVVALAVQTASGTLSGLLLVWAVLGQLCLGAISAVALVRYRLLAPTAVLALVLLATGVSAFAVTVGTPAESYALFWPVYALLVCGVAVLEALVRFVVGRTSRLQRGRSSSAESE